MQVLSIVLLGSILFLNSCTAGAHRRAVSQPEETRLTVGSVQREIRTGMSGGEVVQVLGSPNIVSTDEQGREVWIMTRFRLSTPTPKAPAMERS